MRSSERKQNRMRLPPTAWGGKFKMSNWNQNSRAWCSASQINENDQCGCKAGCMVRSSGNPASQQVCLAPYSTQAPWELWTEFCQQLMKVRLMTRNKWHSSLRLPLFYWLHNYVLAIMQYNLDIITCVLNISFVYRVIFLPLFGLYYLNTNDNTRSQ